MNWREKFTNIEGDYEEEINVRMGARRERGGHLAHLGASGLLIGGDTQLPAIHQGPLRPLDNSYDSAQLQLATSIIPITPLAWEWAWWGWWVTGSREGWNSNI